MILIPQLERSLVRGNGLRVERIHVAAPRLLGREETLFTAEDNRADAGETRLRVVNAGLHFVRIRREGLIDEWTRTDYRHIAEEDIEELGKLIDLRLAQEIAHRQDARILLHRVESACHVRRVAKHRCELPDLEVLALVADASLSVKDIMLARTLEPDHDRNQERREDENRKPGGKDIERAFEEVVHIFRCREEV